MSRNSAEETTKFPERFRLGSCVFDLRTKELQGNDGTAVRLRGQSADVLAHLLHHNGQTVSKAALFDAVWGEASVTDDSLVQCISEIRRCLGDCEHTIVRTLSKKGYAIHAKPVSIEPVSKDLLQHDRPSIAVLAFEDFSAGADKGYLSDAIAEGVIAELSRFTELSLTARNSGFSFRDTPTPITAIAHELGVRYLIEGSQQKAGNRIRVTSQLIDALDGRHIWSETYEQSLDDLFSAQDEIVRRIVATVAQKIIKHEVVTSQKQAQSQRTALLYHLEGRQHLARFTPEANERARQANLAAIQSDPSQPYGYVGLAFVYINGHRWGWSPLGTDEALHEARIAAQKALEIAPDYYDGYAAMAYVHLEENDIDRAIAFSERALKLNPNDTIAMCDLADFLGYAGRADEAEVLLDRAMRLDPLHPDYVRWNMAWIQWLGGKFEQALQTMNAMSETPPMANRVLAIIYASLGQHDEGRAAVQKLVDFDPGYSIVDVERNYAGKFKDDCVLKRLLSLLRRVGLPG